MQMFPPFYMPQAQRAAFFPSMTSFRPWQGGPVHRPYGGSYVHSGNQRHRPMGPRGGQMGSMNRANNPQRMGQRGMQQTQQSSTLPNQQVTSLFSDLQKKIFVYVIIYTGRMCNSLYDCT